MSTSMSTSTSTARRAAPLALALVLGLGAAAPAHASSTTRPDPADDVFLASVGGGIDLAAVRLETRDRSDRPTRIRVTFTLHSPVPRRSLKAPGGLRVQFLKGTQIRREVGITTHDGVLRGEVCQDPGDDDHGAPGPCRRVRVTRVDATTYRAVVRLDHIEPGARVLRWTASSLDISNGYPVSDRITAPDSRPFRWRL